MESAGVGLVLEYIDKNEKTSQRKISKGNNMALGYVNAILQMCIKKGLIKIEKINSRNIKYLLTPKGIIEKTKTTYNYLQSAINRVMALKSNLDLLFEIDDTKLKQIVFYGKNDESQTILKQLISEKKSNNVVFTDDFENVTKLESAVIVVWQPEALQKCWMSGVKCINILNNTQIENNYDK